MSLFILMTLCRLYLHNNHVFAGALIKNGFCLVLNTPALPLMTLLCPEPLQKQMSFMAPFSFRALHLSFRTLYINMCHSEHPPPCHPERSEGSHTDCARPYENIPTYGNSAHVTAGAIAGKILRRADALLKDDNFYCLVRLDDDSGKHKHVSFRAPPLMSP